ncbi:MAG: TRAP transporter substrate-binding protein [Pseudomonadota bacterium]|nr:TRAP transporter substrate-binding protein [Pseudomonadota bacterium]
MEAIQIRLGGYGPPETSFSRALQKIGENLEAHFGSGVEVNYVWNIMDLGYLGRDILWLVENGILTAGYQSTSYLTDRVPELGFLDLPFLFADNETARANMDGALGTYLTAIIEDRCNYRIAGYFENGFRHISNRLRPVRKPADLAGMKIRVLPSAVHEKTFALLGTEPMQMDLTEAIAGVSNGTLDAQENPFANTVTYGVHNHHRYHTLSSHFYLSRPIFINRTQFDSWPEEVRQAFGKAVGDAVNFQRGLAATEADDARRAIEAVGGSIVKLSPSEQAAFAAAVVPVREEAVSKFGEKMFNLLRLETG